MKSVLRIAAAAALLTQLSGCALSSRVTQLETSLAAINRTVSEAADTSASPNCVRHHDIQTCWGEARVEVGRMVGRSYIHPFSAAYPSSFVETPTVNHSVLVNFPPTAPAYSVYSYEIGPAQWSGLLRLNSGEGTNPPNVRVVYTAVGRWRR
jgi:hypothetical protein